MSPHRLQQPPERSRGQNGFLEVEAIGTYSNLASLREKYSDLRKRIHGSPMRPRLLRNQGPPRCSKRFLTARDVAEIVQKYESGNTTQDPRRHRALHRRSFTCVAWRSVPRIPHDRSHRASAAGDPIAAATRLDLDFAAAPDTWFCPASAG
jgi:hypothetical protein